MRGNGDGWRMSDAKDTHAFTVRLYFLLCGEPHTYSLNQQRKSIMLKVKRSFLLLDVASNGVKTYPLSNKWGSHNRLKTCPGGTLSINARATRLERPSRQHLASSTKKYEIYSLRTPCADAPPPPCAWLSQLQVLNYSHTLISTDRNYCMLFKNWLDTCYVPATNSLGNLSARAFSPALAIVGIAAVIPVQTQTRRHPSTSDSSQTPRAASLPPVWVSCSSIRPINSIPRGKRDSSTVKQRTTSPARLTGPTDAE